MIYGLEQVANDRQVPVKSIVDPVPHSEALPGGDAPPLNDLVTVLYRDLRRIAAIHLRGERAGHTLQTTALVHEAYVKLSGDDRKQFNGQTHFLAVASRVMRQVLLDYARARAARKRSCQEEGDPNPGASLTLQVSPSLKPVDLLELDRALDALAREDESLARVIEMRYFGGMTAEETAQATDRSVHAVRHDIRFAQAWLRRDLLKSGN